MNPSNRPARIEPFRRFACIGATVAALLLITTGNALAQAREQTHAELVYLSVDDRELALDLYLPENIENPPLVVWVHGGAW